MESTKADASVPIDPLLAGRYSGRAYDPQREVAAGTVQALLEAARWAPSCYGDQPWNYIVCRKRQEAGAWNAALECLAPGNREWAESAPLLLLAIARGDFRQRPNPNRWAGHDTGAANMALCLQASSAGLIAHQMGGFDHELARSKFSIPESHTVMSFIAIGHPLEADAIPEPLLERENRPRERLPLSHNFFCGNWEGKLEL